MRAVVCEAFGGPETLVVREAPDPAPGRGEVLVETAMVGLNFFDTLLIQDKYQFKASPPFSPGGEFSGRVAALGPGVEDLAVGQRVAGYMTYGAARSHLVVRPDAVVTVPDEVSDEAAAGLFVTYGTTLHALRQRGDLQPGETLAVLGASRREATIEVLSRERTLQKMVSPRQQPVGGQSWHVDTLPFGVRAGDDNVSEVED